MAAKKRPTFNDSLCVSCSICVQLCPFSCIELLERRSGSDKNLYPMLTGDCIGCGACSRGCPMGAVSMEDIG